MAIIKAAEHGWVGHPDGGGKAGTPEALIVERRADAEVLGEVCDAEASYSYDDYALVRLDGWYYHLNTSGCSCPSPTETWGVVFGPGTLEEVRAHVVEDAEKRGYGVTKRQLDEFIAMFDAAKALPRRRRGSKPEFAK